MSRTISSQLQYVVLRSNALGSSKHDARKNGTSKHKTFSHKSLEKRLDVAKDLGKYIKNNYDTKLVRDITPEQVNAWLNSKALAGATKDTLQSYASNARFLVGTATETFAGCKDFSKQIKTPQEHPEARRTGRDPEGMLKADYNQLRDGRKDGNLARGMDIARMTGARAYGCVNLRGSDIHDNNGNMYVTLTEKGGLTRNVDVVRPEYQRELYRLAQRFGDNKVVPIKEESLEKALYNAMKKVDLSKDYRYAKMHAIRKTWANERYNEYRQDHTKLETIEYINQQLGHSADRDEELLSHYVAHIW